MAQNNNFVEYLWQTACLIGGVDTHFSVVFFFLGVLIARSFIVNIVWHLPILPQDSSRHFNTIRFDSQTHFFSVLTFPSLLVSCALLIFDCRVLPQCSILLSKLTSHNNIALDQKNTNIELGAAHECLPAWVFFPFFSSCYCFEAYSTNTKLWMILRDQYIKHIGLH